MPNSTRDRWLAATYAATIFVSAFLLFQVQPLVSKHILPWFGGSPAVWTVCMLFFQALLLAGYVYAHLSQKWLNPARQVVAQWAIVALAVMSVLVLSVLPNDDWQPEAGTDPVARILAILAVSVGLPFFVLATTAPLIQAWFAHSFPGRVPYRLYALSNLASLVALLSYPYFFERAFDLPEQARLWTWGFVAYGVLCTLAGVWLWRSSRVSPKLELASSEITADESATGKASSDEREFRLDSPTWWQYVLWLLLPTLSTVAFLATTSHVCTDVAAVPLLWVVPLALYLATFIIAFDHPRWYRRTPWAVLTLVSIYGAALSSRESFGWVELYDFGTTGRLIRMAFGSYLNGSPQLHLDYYAFLLFNFSAMFGFCMLCHGELVRLKPHPRHLTSFYLMIAAGGVLGGVAVTLLAPQIFRTYFEWQLIMFFGAVWAIALVLHWLVQAAFPSDSKRLIAPGRATLALVTLVVLLVPMSLAMLDLVEYLQVPDEGILLRKRNFFGTLAVREREGERPQDKVLVLYHGFIAHGSQFIEPSRRGQPTTYYSTVSGIGRTLDAVRRHIEPRGMRVGVVGLGTGTVAAYVGGGDSITFYEINPAVVDLADSGRWFTYLHDCRARGGTCEIKLGDARITLQRDLAAGRPGRFHVLALDAFSGDAIPVHLLTGEAFDTYAQHLANSSADGVDGALVVHVSNRYLDLEPVVRAAAERIGFSIAHIHTPREPAEAIYEAEWMVLTRNKSLLQALAPYATTAGEPVKPAILWTDDRSNLLDVVK